MKKVKRILALSLSAVLLLALLCACGDPGAQNSDPAGGNTSDPSAPASQGPSAEPPVGSVQVDLAAFYLALAGKYQVPETPEQAIPDELADDDDMWLDGPESREERLQSLEQQRNDLRDMTMMNYPGLTDIATEQCLVYAPMMSFSASEAALIQVSSAADVDAVKAILQARVDAQKNGGAWYPAAVEGWENNSRIVSNGSYIMLIVGEDCDAIVDEFNAVMADPSYVPAPNPSSRDDGSGGAAGAPVEPTGRTAADADLEAFLWAVADAYDLPSLDLPPTEWVSGDIPGLVGIPCVQRVVAQGMMSPPVCKIVLIQVANSSDVQKVCDILEAYIDAKIETDAAYNVEQWQNNASVEVSGNYIMMVANAHHDPIVADFHAFIADPSYVPAPAPDSGNDDPGDEPNNNPGGGVGPGIGPLPVPGAGTEPDGGNESGGGLGGFVIPVPGTGSESGDAN